VTEDSDSEDGSENEGTVQESVLPDGSEVGAESDRDSADEVTQDLLVGEDSDDD
jgi:hypothetical protein